MRQKWKHIVGWAGVVVGLSGVIPGIFLLRGPMIEFGLVLVLLGVLILVGLETVEELRQVRRSLARLVIQGEKGQPQTEPVGVKSAESVTDTLEAPLPESALIRR